MTQSISTALIHSNFVLGMMKDLASISKRGGDILSQADSFSLWAWASRLDVLMMLASSCEDPAATKDLYCFIQDCVSLVNNGQAALEGIRGMADEEGYAFEAGEEWDITYFDGVQCGETVPAVIAKRYLRSGDHTPMYCLQFEEGGDQLPVTERQLYVMTNSDYRATRDDLLRRIGACLRTFGEEK